jgi:hypothetical protein
MDIENLSPIDVMRFCYQLTGRVLYRHEAEMILEPYWNGTQADLEYACKYWLAKIDAAENKLKTAPVGTWVWHVRSQGLIPTIYWPKYEINFMGSLCYMRLSSDTSGER